MTKTALISFNSNNKSNGNNNKKQTVTQESAEDKAEKHGHVIFDVFLGMIGSKPAQRHLAINPLGNSFSRGDPPRPELDANERIVD